MYLLQIYMLSFASQCIHPAISVYRDDKKIVLFTACRWCSSGKLICCRCDYRRRQKMGSGWSYWFSNIRFCYRTRYGGGKGDNDNDDAIIMMMRGCRKGGSIIAGQRRRREMDSLPCVHKIMCIKLCAAWFALGLASYPGFHNCMGGKQRPGTHCSHMRNNLTYNLQKWFCW